MVRAEPACVIGQRRTTGGHRPQHLAEHDDVVAPTDEPLDPAGQPAGAAREPGCTGVELPVDTGEFVRPLAREGGGQDGLPAPST